MNSFSSGFAAGLNRFFRAVVVEARESMSLGFNGSALALDSAVDEIRSFEVRWVRFIEAMMIWMKWILL